MSSTSSQNFESFISEYGTVPAKWEDAQAHLSEQLKKICQAINIRKIGWRLNQQTLTGEQFVPSTNTIEDPANAQFRSVFSTTVNCGTLPNATTSTIAHGIDIDSTFTLVAYYGGATKPTSTFPGVVLPYPSLTLNHTIEVSIDQTNIYITTGIDYSAYTRSYITIDYLLEV